MTRQVAADLSSVVYNSLTSVQFPGRDEFYLRLAKAKALHEKAHKVCFIANSVNFPVRNEPEIVEAAGA